MIRHPGPAVPNRIDQAACSVERIEVILPSGADLLDVLHSHVAGWDGAAVDLAGLVMGPYCYVMPAQSADGHHAAWYSDTHSGQYADVQAGTALLGWRDDSPWFHAHALWQDGRACMGHLLPGKVTVARSTCVVMWRWKGPRLDLRQDPETGFPIYHMSTVNMQGNGALVRLAPHVDLVMAVSEVLRNRGWKKAHILGVGSLIGAGFAAGRDMASPISEALLFPEVHCGPNTLDLVCVDPDGGVFQGRILEGKGAVLITFEILMIEACSGCS
jgi:predicted DNA-binding protein with PD1-like motif